MKQRIARRSRKSRRGSRLGHPCRRTVEVRNAIERPAWEAMHAPSLDAQRTGAAPCRSSIPANHVTVGPGAESVRPQEGQSCVFFIKPSHLRHRHIRLAERSARDAAFR